jgi:hypothetical protein
LTATKASDGDYSAANSTITVALERVVATVTLKSSANDVLSQANVTLTATVSFADGTPTGSIVFYDGGAPLNGTPSTLQGGSASLTIGTLAVGTHQLTAVYGGDSDFLSESSSAVGETVQDFQLTLSGGTGSVSATVQPGGVASYQLTLSPTHGSTFPSLITLSLSGLPAGATYTITPATIAPGSGPQVIFIQVQTAQVGATLRNPGPHSPLWVFALLVPLFGIVHLHRATLQRAKSAAVVLALLPIALAFEMSSCGGGGGFLNRSPQSYSLQLIATPSEGLSHSATLNLTVQ